MLSLSSKSLIWKYIGETFKIQVRYKKFGSVGAKMSSIFAPQAQKFGNFEVMFNV